MFYISCFNEKTEYSSNFQDKFEKDKCCHMFEDGDVVIQDGVLYNKTHLAKNHNNTTIDTLIRSLYKEDEHYFKSFRGSFSGAYFDSSQCRWTVFTNHMGDNAVYYYAAEDGFVASSDPKNIVKVLKERGVEYSLDETTVYYLLTYGYIVDESTYADKIKRLLPGQFITYLCKNQTYVVDYYYKLKRDKIDVSNVTFDDAIDEIDRLFRRAVKYEYDKDVEYGYRHLCELSGGLDSRMNFWVAHEMGYKDILAYTFGQGNCPDEMVAKEIADYWHENIMVWPSNAAKFMGDIERLSKLVNGSVFYYGSQMQSQTFDCMDMSQYGLIHSGQIGDVVIGTFISKPSQVKEISKGGEKAHSSELFGHYTDRSIGKYGFLEEQLIMTRGLMGCCASHFVAREYSEVASPFMDPDLMDYCMSLPIEWRIGHHIYKYWIIKKYPEATKFIWASKGFYITEPDWKISLREKKRKAKWVIKNPSVILKKMGFTVKEREHGNSSDMTPVDEWYRRNQVIREKMEESFDDLYETSMKGASDTLKKDVYKLFYEKHTTEKAMVLSALYGIRCYF